MTGALIGSIETLSQGLDELLPALHKPTVDAELVDAQRQLHTVARKVYAAQLELDAAVDHAGLHQHHGYPTVKAMLTDMLRLHPREAADREAHREQLAHRRSLTGQLLPPRLPATSGALAQGVIGAAHVEVIDKVMAALPDTLDLPTRTVVEQQLAGFARDYSPRETGVLAAQLIEHLDPDGPEPHDADAAERPNLLFLGRARGGRLRLRGEFDTEGQAAIRALLGALAVPHPPVDGIPDDRSLAQRQGDALVEAAHQVLGFGTLPEAGGERPQVVITIGLAELEQRLRAAMLDFGAKLHPETARLLACDAQVIPVLLGSGSQPLDVGRASRSVPTGMRRALIGRAGGRCEMPGCERPASWCDAHHIRHWSEGGPTRIDNLTLLCRRLIDWCTNPDGTSGSTPTGIRCSPHPHSSTHTAHPATADYAVRPNRSFVKNRHSFETLPWGSIGVERDRGLVPSTTAERRGGDRAHSARCDPAPVPRRLRSNAAAGGTLMPE